MFAMKCFSFSFSSYICEGASIGFYPGNPTYRSGRLPAPTVLCTGERLKARKQLLVSNGVRRSYHTLLLEKSCHRARETTVFIGPHRSSLVDPALTIQPNAEWIVSRMSLNGCCSGHTSCQGARFEVSRDVHNSKHNRVDPDQPDDGQQPGRRLGGDQNTEDDRGQSGQSRQRSTSTPHGERERSY